MQKHSHKDIDNSIKFNLDRDKTIQVFKEDQYKYVLGNSHLLQRIDKEFEDYLKKHIYLKGFENITDFEYYERVDNIPLVPGFYVNINSNKCYVIL